MLRPRAIKATLGALLLFATLVTAAGESFAGEQLIGTSCSGNENNVDYDTIGQCVSTTFQRVAPFLAGSVAIGTTSLTAGTVLDLGSNTSSMLLPIGSTGQEPSPATAGMIRWNSTTNHGEVFNGGAWAPFWKAPSAPAVTAPSGSGYFVISGTTWNGNLGGRIGADALCLTEIATTNTGWMGYSTANSNGQLIAAKVHAFICDTTVCNNLMPLTKYYFANATNGSAGGAFFVTDSSGDGPQNATNWSGSTLFDGNYNVWSGRANGSAGLTWSPSPTGTACTSWSVPAGTGYYGITNSANSARWDDTTANCTSLDNLICFVNP